MTRIKIWLAAIGAFLLAVFTFGQIKRSEGRQEAEHDITESDRKRADSIRDRVRDVPDRVREFEGDGWRD